MYDYELDRAVELSQVAMWIVAHGLHKPRSLRELVDELAGATGDATARAQVALTAQQIVLELLDRGLIDIAAEEPGDIKNEHGSTVAL